MKTAVRRRRHSPCLLPYPSLRVPRLPGVFATLLAAGLLLGPAGAAQRLPQGELHVNRERSVDLQHLDAELGFDFAAGRVEGRATLTLTPLRALTRVTLDALQLDVTGVTVGGETEQEPTALEVTHDGRSLEITLPREAAPGEEVVLTVTWSAAPRAGMYFQPNQDSPGLWWVTTYGEGGLHANWLPIYNDVNDKFSSEMRITVPPPYSAVSNGRLVGKTEEADGAVTWHWRQELPHSNYLISVYVGDFERGELPPAFGEIPVAYWVPRGRLEEGAYAFRNTTRMIEHYSHLFGYRYPWDKYDQIAIPDYAIGAMEHTGVTGHKASVLRRPGEAPADFGPPALEEYWTDWTAEATISHELAHHWFGDLVTCRNLAYLWLNESFASYLMMLWDEKALGRDQLLFDVELARRHYFRFVEDEHRIRPLEYHRFDAPNDIYNTEHTYLKGAAFLHMLRSILGDEAFFRALGDYLHRHAFGNVESRDLELAIQDSAGRNLEWLFDDWVTGGGHPVLEISWRWLPEQQAVDLAVEQVQPVVEGQGLFRLPAKVTLATAESTWEVNLTVEEAEGHWLLPAPEKPRMVSFDGGGDLIAEIRFDKKPEELLFQAAHDALPGRLRALGQLARRWPSRPETAEAFAAALDPAGFWALQAEAARLLGTVRTPEAEALVDGALASPDDRVRQAAVLALPELGGEAAKERLLAVIADDPSNDVVATAVVALAHADPATDLAVFHEQLGRGAWHEEIRLAALQALAEIGTPAVEELARPFVTAAWNQDVRQAAFEAWEAADPADPELHRALQVAAGEPPYALQQFALEALGRLGVEDALSSLDEWVEADLDANLTQKAEQAAAEIRRLRAASPGDAEESRP